MQTEVTSFDGKAAVDSVSSRNSKHVEVVDSSFGFWSHKMKLTCPPVVLLLWCKAKIHIYSAVDGFIPVSVL